MKKIMIITTIVFFMIIVLISCSSSTRKPSSTPESKPTITSKTTIIPKPLDTAGQIGRQYYEDVFVRKEDWIYTSVFYLRLPEGMYRTKDLCGDRYTYRLICNDKADSINVIGDKIYYVNISDGNKIYSINTDGTNKQELLNIPVRYLYISDNTMFFTDNGLDDKGNVKGWLYSAKTDGSQLKCINSQITNNVYISDGWIYFIEGKWGGSAILLEGLSKIRIDGTEKTIITKNKIWNIVVSGDWIYYNDMFNGGTSNLYKMKKDGTQITKISDDNLMCKNNEVISCSWKVCENYIYYVNASDGSKLYRISIAGTDKKVLNEEKCAFINLEKADNFIYILTEYYINDKQCSYTIDKY